MLLKKIYVSLTHLGFTNIGINRDNISLFQQVVEEGVFVVAIYDCPTGLEYTTEQLSNINKQIQGYFLGKRYNNINLLGIICTNKVDNVRDISRSNNNLWIIDTNKSQLVIYENQEESFPVIRKQITNILYNLRNTDESNNTIELSQDSPNHLSTKSVKSIISQYITQWNTIIIIACILVYFIVNFISIEKGNNYLVLSGALYWPSIVRANEYHRLITYMFLHANTTHLANNMLVLFFLGDNLERAAGKWRFLIIYFGSGIIAGFVSMSYNMINNLNVISVGASGAIFGVVGAMANIVIRNRGRLENISTRQMVLFVVFSLYGGLTSQGVDNAAHIGGLISGFVLAAVFYRRPKKRQIKFMESY